MNSVNSIYKLLSKRPVNEEKKITLKNLGPPRPNFEIEVKEKRCPQQRTYLSKFDTELYNLADWLCGCPFSNSLYCYICLIMDAERGNVQSDLDLDWVRKGVSTGITNNTELRMKVKNHERNQMHQINSLDYALLGKSKVMKLSGDYFLKINMHNERVRRRRHVLSKLIDCVRFGSYENFSQEMGNILENATDGFNELSNTVVTSLLETIHSVCLDLIRKEIERTDYVSLQVDEVGDSETSKLVMILRYELNGQIHERLVGVFTPENKDVVVISNLILAELSKLNLDKTTEKMISQSYEGLLVINKKEKRIRSRIKQVYKKASPVHNYSHKFDLVVEQAAFQLQQVRIFFAELDNFASFFSNGKCIAALDKVVALRLPQGHKTQWDFESQGVLTVQVHKNDIVKCLDDVIDAEADGGILREAVILKNLLTDRRFIYGLELFSRVLPGCSELFYDLRQDEGLDHRKVLKYVETFKTRIRHVQGEIEQKFNPLDCSPPPHKRSRVDEVTVKKEVIDEVIEKLDFKQEDDSDLILNGEAAAQVCDLIIEYIEDRFSTSDYFSLAALVQPSLFHTYETVFPKEEVLWAASVFKLNSGALTHELGVLYKRAELRQAGGTVILLRYFYENCLLETFPETTKLLKIICTIPMVTCDRGRCFETLMEARKFLRGAGEDDNVGVLAVCFLEKELMQVTPDFNERVLEHFCYMIKGAEDFIYK